MTEHQDTELTAEESAAFAALPRERNASEMLEHRTVRALRARGLIGQAGKRWVRAWMAAAGVAAAAALFAGGLAVGQWLGTRTVTETMVNASAENALEMAVAVQRAGSAYVTALSVLAQTADTSSNGAIAQGREAALTALYAAVHELVLLAPEDPVAVTLRDVLERQRQVPPDVEQLQVRNVVWF